MLLYALSRTFLVTVLVDLVRSRRDALEVAVQQKAALLQREVPRAGPNRARSDEYLRTRTAADRLRFAR